MVDLLLIALGLVALAGGLVLRARRARQANDEIYAGVTPGVIPPGDAPVEQLPTREYVGEVAVAFSPPRDLPPGLAGTVVDGKAETRDVVATVVDLAVRQHLTIQAVDAAGHPAGQSARPEGRDWLLTRRAGSDGLLPHEASLMDALFAFGPTVRLSEVVRAGGLQATRQQLRDEMTLRGWYVESAGPRITSLAVAFPVLVLLSLLLAVGLGASSWVLLGVAAAIAGLWLALSGSKGPHRTATGTALRIQTLGFKRYLETAEARQLSFEEAAGTFSRYLPYAIVLGVAQHWAKVFRDVLVAAREAGYDGTFELGWMDTYLVADTLSNVMLMDALADIGAVTDVPDMAGDWSGDQPDTGAVDGSGDGGGWDFGGGDFGGGDFGGGDFGGGDGGGGGGD